MRLRVHSVAGKMPAWVQAGVDEYGKRLPREWAVEWVDLPLAKRSKNVKTLDVIAQETDRLLKSVRNDHLVLLDISGKNWSTEELAESMAAWQHAARDVSLVIGGPDGVDDRLRQRADQRWSLSRLTLPHPLVRVLLAEQIYRAFTVLQGHPYHK